MTAVATQEIPLVDLRAQYATIDAGVERRTVIGRDCLVMAHAYVAHDVQTGDRVQIGPSSVIGGCVTIGHDVKIGLNATILPWRSVGDGARIGAGAVVTKNIPAGEVWAGNPAVQLKEDIRDLVCFAGIYPHAYSWLADLPAREKVGV